MVIFDRGKRVFQFGEKTVRNLAVEFGDGCIFGTAWIEKALLYVFILTIIALCIIIYRTQKYIWNIDMKNKKERTP